MEEFYILRFISIHTHWPKIPYVELIFSSTLSQQRPEEEGYKVDVILSFSEFVFVKKLETHMPSPESISVISEIIQPFFKNSI